MEREGYILEIYLAQDNHNLEVLSLALLQCLILFLRAWISSVFLLSFFFFFSLFCGARSWSLCADSLVAASEGYSVPVHTLLREVASLVGEHSLQVRGLQQLPLLNSRAQARQLWHMGLVALWHVGGIFLDQGSNLWPLHWQLVSYPLRHQRNLDSINFLSKPFLSHFPSTILNIRSYQITAQIENNWLIQYYINSGKCSLSSICLSQLGKMYQNVIILSYKYNVF